MGRGEERAKQRFAAQNKTKARNKLFMIGGLLLLIIIAGVLFIQNTSSYSYTEQTSDRPMAGNPQAAVVLTEYSDLQCPACAAAHPVVVRLKDEYADTVRIEFKHFPLQSIHPYAFEAAVGAECAHDMGMFWDYIDVLFVNQNKLSRKDLISHAQLIGLDAFAFEQCLRSGEKDKYVRSDLQQGLRANVQGTPTFFVNGQAVSGFSYDALKRALDQAIALNAPVQG